MLTVYVALKIKDNNFSGISVVSVTSFDLCCTIQHYHTLNNIFDVHSPRPL